MFAGGHRVFATPPSAALYEEVAAAVVAALPPDDPLALNDVLVLAPNRRAVSAVTDAFASIAGGATLLPIIRPLADLDDDPDVWGAEPIALDAPAAIAPLRRRLELARLVRARDDAESGSSEPVRALAFADELCRMLDAQSVVEHVDWTALGRLVAERDFARHWQESAQFLEIVTHYWPQRLAADGVLDASTRRSAILRALAAHWREHPPQTPVIIAGSTGSVSATRTLMDVVRTLPRGAVVLPGLDHDLDDAAWDMIEPSHPQYHLKATLAALNIVRSDVLSLCRKAEAPAARARRIFVREALAPPSATADWRQRLAATGGEDLVRVAAIGLSLVEARSEDEEASVAAVLMRETLETDGATVAMVTPDASLARRVEAKLARWGVKPVMTIGSPLAESEAGRLLDLCARLMLDQGDPLMIAALLAHPRVQIGANRDAVRALEMAALRGPRRHGDLQSLADRLTCEMARSVVTALEAALQPLLEIAAREALLLSDFAAALSATVESLCGSTDGDADAAWLGEDGAAASRLLSDLAEHGEAFGPIEAIHAARTLAALMSGVTIAPSHGGDPRAAIYGPLEARSLRRDLVILCGLNEGTWPASPPEDALLSRAMREAVGLAPHEARIGLAAHDFTQAANAPRVVLTRSLTVNGQPSVASRWLWRLRILAQAAGEASLLDPPTARDPREWARAMDAPRARLSIPAPKPKPPAEARPKRVSVTEVETLIRDPYAVYARRVLGLREAPAFAASASHSERGQALHAALHKFGDGADLQALLDLLCGELADAGFDQARLVSERIRFEASLEAYIFWSRARVAQGAHPVREVAGQLLLPSGTIVHGRADRLDVLRSGAIDVIDFKTGQPPSKAQVESGLAPQLTLEAAMAARGGFEGVKAGPPGAVIYVRLGGREASFQSLSIDTAAQADIAIEALDALMARYLSGTIAYLSKPRVQFVNADRTTYDLLARRAEWADSEGES